MYGMDTAAALQLVQSNVMQSILYDIISYLHPFLCLLSYLT